MSKTIRVHDVLSGEDRDIQVEVLANGNHSYAVSRPKPTTYRLAASGQFVTGVGLKGGQVWASATTAMVVDIYDGTGTGGFRIGRLQVAAGATLPASLGDYECGVGFYLNIVSGTGEVTLWVH